MEKTIRALTERLRSIADDVDHPGLWRRWLSAPLPISPWEAWTLLCLVRHRERQQFVADTVVARLGGSLQALATSGYAGHPDRPGRGVVPGDDDWEYYFHGRGCCLTHRQSGEAIDVDFYDDSCDWTDPYFFVWYLESLKAPAFVEERVKALHPRGAAVRLAMRRLKDAGLLETFEESSGVRVGFQHEAIAELLARIEERWGSAEVRCCLGAALGDWGCVASLVEGDDSATSERLHSEHVAERAAALESDFDAGVDRAESLHALRALGSDRLEGVLRRCLAGPPSGETSAAPEVLAQIDSDWTDEVEALINRINANGEIPQPYVWRACAEYLLRRGRSSGIKQTLRRIESNCLGDAALLALEFFPDIAVETFRRALRSEIPCNRITAAAALAIVDQPWGRAELAGALDASDDHEQTSECRSALMTTHSREAHEKVREWEARHPREAEEGPFISMTEMSLRMSDETINYEMEKLHDRVLPLRGTVVPVPPKRWWGR